MSGKKTNRRAENGEGSFRYNSAGSLEYRFTYKDRRGNTKRKSVSGKNKSECLSKAEEIKNTVSRKKVYVDPDITIITILENRYRKDLTMGFVGEQGYCRNLGNLNILRKADFADIPIRYVTEDDIIDYFEVFSNYSESMVSKLYGQIRLGFALAKQQNVIQNNFMESRDMKCPKTGKPPKKVCALTRAEQKKFVDRLSSKAPPEGRGDYRLQLMIELYSGMRMGEINALKAEHIDLKNNVIHVRQTVSRGIDYRDFIKDGTKTKTGQRDIPISNKLRPYLEEALRKQKKNKEGLVFYDYNKDSVISTGQVNSYYKRVCKAIGITECGQHALRHTFATRCIESGVPAVVLKNWLGHTNIHITLDTYTDVFNGMNNNAIDKLDDYLNEL